MHERLKMLLLEDKIYLKNKNKKSLKLTFLLFYKIQQVATSKVTLLFKTDLSIWLKLLQTFRTQTPFKQVNNQKIFSLFPSQCSQVNHLNMTHF